MSTQNVLIELLVEELPPKALKKLGEAFADAIFESLKAQGLTAASSKEAHFATPRRLAVHVTAVTDRAADHQVAQKLMPATIGLDTEGKATPALLKRLSGLGMDASALAQLRTENDGKTDNLFLDMVQTGVTLAEGLQAALNEALTKLPIPKVMSYQLNDGWETVNFVRPAHGLVALHGSEIVPVTALGLTSGNITYGHRFLSKGRITLPNADSYEDLLYSEGKVIASFDERKKLIDRLLEEKRVSKESDGVIKPDNLLEEVTALVEWPVVYECHFDTEFLQVPEECLILTMQTNQKYFPCTIGNALTKRFLIVSNIETNDTSAIIGGNERVVRPRLADAKFFFDQDRKKTLESRLGDLDKVVYHNKLGSQGERNARVVKIATEIAKQLGDAQLVAKVEQATRLSKADLLTDMVGEFPELQGIMGWYYARHENIDNDVALAISEHYKPRFAGDALPSNDVGICVALADKLETLVGLFGIGEKPTGDKDPFALRRHALGVIRMLVERRLALNLSDLVIVAAHTFDTPAAQPEVINDNLLPFIYERVVSYLRELGYSAKEVDAVTSVGPMWGELPKCLEAVRRFGELPEAPALAAANKRIGNILKKAEDEVKAEVKTTLLQEPAEKALSEALDKIKPEADRLFENGEYTTSLRTLAALKAPVDVFFDNVMVNADDPALKANRLGLLAILHQTMNRVADLSKLAS